jgi:hypothetical protein
VVIGDVPGNINASNLQSIQEEESSSSNEEEEDSSPDESETSPKNAVKGQPTTTETTKIKICGRELTGDINFSIIDLAKSKTYLNTPLSDYKGPMPKLPKEAALKKLSSTPLDFSNKVRKPKAKIDLTTAKRALKKKTAPESQLVRATTVSQPPAKA